MESRERRRLREEKTRKKSNRDKSEEYEEKNNQVSATSETITTSTYPEDSLISQEYAEMQLQKNEHRKMKERCQQRNNQEQKSKSEEQKNDPAMHHVGKPEETEDTSRNESDKAILGRHEKSVSDDLDKKHRTRSQPEHKRTKEHRECKETKKTTHHSPSRNRSDEQKNRTAHEVHKSKETNHHIKSKSINEKLEQLEGPIKVEAVKNKASNSTKHSAQKETIEMRDDDMDTHNGGKHNSQKENISDRKNTDEVRHGRSSKKSSSKGKTEREKSSGEKSKRSASENRDNVTKQSSSDRRQRQRKRTESQRDRKKEKRCKRCRSHLYKVEPHRAYYSDSELDCGNTATRVKSSVGTFGTDSDVSAMCHVFSTKGVNIMDSSQSTKDSKDSKDSSQHKTPQHVKRSDTLICDKCNRTSKSTSKTSRSTTSDSIRNKLITALFQRIKSLLKETEELKQERNALNEKVTMLSSQYEKLKAKEEIQAEQEHLIKEKIETLAEEMKISNKDKKKSICWADDTSNSEKACCSGEAKPSSSTFRDEVHHILKNIQRKYQTHWKEHEHKINQVQTDAENEIQSLMKNIVTKYVEIGEIKDRNEGATNMIQSKHVTEPLYISTKTNSNSTDLVTSTNQSVGEMYEMFYSKAAQSKNDLLLKVADPTKSGKSKKKQSLQALCREHLMKTNIEAFPLQQQQENHNKHINFDKPNQSGFLHPRESMMPKFTHTNKYSLATCEVLSRHNNAMKTDHEIEKNFPLSSEDSKVALQPPRSTSDDIKLSYINNKHLTNGNALVPDKTNKTTEQGLLTKKDTREFWRQKLSQPLPVDTHKEYKENDINSHAHQRRNFN